MARRLPLLLALSLTVGCESVIGLGDLTFDRAAPTGSSTSTGSTTSSTADASSSTTSSASTSTGGGEGGDGAGGQGGAGGRGGAGGHGGAGGSGGSGGQTPTYADLVLADAPVAYWRLGEVEGELVAEDLAGDHDGIYFSEGSGEYVQGEAGALSDDADTAVTFVGGGHVLVQDAEGLRFPGKSPLSIELWMKFDAEAGGHTPLVCQDQDTSAGFVMYLDSASFYWKRYGTDPNGDPASQGSPSAPVANDADTWNHVVITMTEDGTERIYVNATLAVLDYVTPIDVVDHDAPLVLGLERFGESPPISLDEVAIFDHPLTPERVVAHYQCGRFGICE